ncbi:hypothetical protein CEXT_32681 [Caerostris extrusa]|uniref:Uncharacterized protein n=1 Tax=Caerostris extrusa TaxID=172846 RepID=A0AAV4SLA5_CAEEX|nr:hypothetical protein CEXT_32681 [Caerostris extrusa]
MQQLHHSNRSVRWDSKLIGSTSIKPAIALQTSGPKDAAASFSLLISETLSSLKMQAFSLHWGPLLVAES